MADHILLCFFCGSKVEVHSGSLFTQDFIETKWQNED